MNNLKTLITKFTFVFSVVCVSLFSSEFTVASYNCGGLSDHYDYIRAVSTQNLIQERYNSEPETMAKLEKIQIAALKILFSKDALEKDQVEQEWNDGNYSQIFKEITSHPDKVGSINKIWREKSEQIVSPYNIRPVVIFDEEVNELLFSHLKDLTRGQGVEFEPENHLNDWLDVTRRVMAERIFHHQLKYDIISLQEADYLDSSMFPNNYEVRFSNSQHSINGMAWNHDKFELIEVIGDILEKGFAVKFRHLATGKTVIVASGHLSGCNPFVPSTVDTLGTLDSDKGDRELQEIIKILENSTSDIKLIAMDSNVTAAHPRLSLLKRADYKLDYLNYLDATCTSPWQVLDTRIDWISVKSTDNTASISNIPVLGIGLNSPQTNVSDHKPIAAKISF